MEEYRSNEFHDDRMLTVVEAMKEVSYPETFERLKKARGGEGFDRYVFLIQKRYLLDSKLESAGVPIEKSFKFVEGEKVSTFSGWWLIKKVRDHCILEWAEEYEQRTDKDYIRTRAID